jgi:hypothetical protein
MTRLTQLKFLVFSAAVISVTLMQCNNPEKKINGNTDSTTTTIKLGEPFRSHRDSVPPTSAYSGPLFQLSHNYPESPLPPMVNPPWQQALNGQPISPANALQYVDALKQYLTPTIMQFLYNREHFNADSAGYYQEPWTGSIREAIMGTYVGSGFGPGTFTSLDSSMSTYVLTFYDKRAAYTLNQIWGKTGEKVNLMKNAAQFDQNSIIVKFAFTTANYPQWSVMQDALMYPIYDTGTAYTDPVYKVRNVSLMQFDIIVKDTITSPKTGWVFSTLVYDKNATGKNVWDKMVPLGAQWGNDPDVNSTLDPKKPLKENVINQKAPEYSRQTLGWGGRLSGPNDGAVIPIASANGKVYKNLQASSCMSCHLTAQDQFLSFLLPGPFPTSNSDTLPVFTPGGPQWLRYYRNLPGYVPFDTNQVGLDFDMVTAFKSIPAYNNTRNLKVGKENLDAAERYRLRPNNKYNGRQ